MKPSSFEQAIQAQFDCLTKKVIKTTIKKYNRDLARRHKKEATFSEMPMMDSAIFGTTDEYECDYTSFHVCGMEVHVSDDELSRALKIIPEKKRNIILLSYFMDMSDIEIGEMLNLVRSTVYRHRTRTLEEIKKILED